MQVLYALIPLLGGWLVYGLIASLFLKRASSRDYLLLIAPPTRCMDSFILQSP